MDPPLPFNDAQLLNVTLLRLMVPSNPRAKQPPSPPADMSKKLESITVMTEEDCASNCPKIAPPLPVKAIREENVQFWMVNANTLDVNTADGSRYAKEAPFWYALDPVNVELIKTAVS